MISVPLERRIVRSFAAGDYQAAADLLERYLAEHPTDPTQLYNAACAYALLAERDRSASYLIRAVQAGYKDFNHLVRDPDLESIREHPKYLAVVEALDRVASNRAHDVLDRWRASYGTDDYRYEKDEKRRLAYATALDDVAHRQMRRMLERQADHLTETLFDVDPKWYVLIAVPTPEDAAGIFRNDSLGGIYIHAKRQLIARDIGGALRHEFVHAIHYAHMNEIRQDHPLWIQEGLASLYEDYEFRPDGSVRFLANERHNVVRRRASGNRLMRWDDLFEISSDRFMGRAGQLYPQVRSIFEYVAERGKLVEWYHAYVDHFDDDRSGVAAFEQTFGQSLGDIEGNWRDWIRLRPAVDVVIAAGDASLGIESRLRGSNDGVLITNVIPGSAADFARLERYDVIVSANDRATRSLLELQTIIGSKEIGEKVRLRVRRGRQYFTVIVTLRPFGR